MPQDRAAAMAALIAEREAALHPNASRQESWLAKPAAGAGQRARGALGGTDEPPPRDPRASFPNCSRCTACTHELAPLSSVRELLGVR